MNAPVIRPVPARPPQRKKLDAGETAFLPAALEILEAPASPLRVRFLAVICAMFVVVVAWSWFAKLDIFAVAPGRIQIAGRSKIVQPLEPGKVKSVYVQNGAKVRAGDPLIDLDPTETEADVTANGTILASVTAEIARRMRTIALVKEETTNSAIVYPDSVPDAIRLRENAALEADLYQFTTTRAGIYAQIAEKRATIRRLSMSVDARGKLIGLLRERVTMRENLVSKESGTRASVIDSLQQLQTEETNLAYDSGLLIEADAAINTLQRRLEQLVGETVATQTEKLAIAQGKYDGVSQAYVKALAKNARTRLSAPIDGSVQQLVVTSVGQVVTTGQSLMVVVPNDGAIEIEATILNSDIGFIEPGQEANIKIDSFPFTRYGTAKGKVIRVSRDAMDDKDVSGASNSLSLAQGQGQGLASGASKTQNLVFAVTLELERDTFSVDGREVPLIPGMTVQVEVRTGERRVIDYLLAPLRETSSRAAHER